MALREGAALAVLAGQAHRVAFVDQRAESQRFGHGPVDALAGLDHLAAIVEQPADGLVHVEPLRDRGEAKADLLQPDGVDAGAGRAGRPRRSAARA